MADPELAIRIWLTDGIVNPGTDAGQSSFRAALELANHERSVYWRAAALLNLSRSSKTLQEYEESIQYGLQALALAQEVKAKRIAAFANNNLGSAYSFLGELDSASEHIEQAIPVLAAIGDRMNLMIGLGELGLIYDREGNTGNAVANYQKAYRIAMELGRKTDAERNAANTSVALMRDRKWDEASTWNDRAAELDRVVKDKNLTADVVKNRAHIAYGLGRLDEAARISRALLSDPGAQSNLRWELHELLGKIAMDSKRFPEANREFEAARKIVEETRSDLLDSHYRITLLSKLIGFYREYVDALVQQNDTFGALRIVESSRARVLAERMGTQIKPEEFPTLPTLQKLARSTNSAFLSFWFAPHRSFAWLISADTFRRFDLPPDDEIERLVTSYRKQVELPIPDPHDQSGPALWNKLLCGIAPYIPKGSRLIVIPDRPLHRLNLETMIAPTPSPHYWIEDVELAIAPSISIAASRPVAAAAHDPSLLLIGAPGLLQDGLQPASQSRGRTGTHPRPFPGCGIARDYRPRGNARVVCERKPRRLFPHPLRRPRRGRRGKAA